MPFFRRSAPAAIVLLLCAAAAAEPPVWTSDPCAGLDCSEVVAGVGQADLLPEIKISSAVAYAEAARQLSSRLSDVVSVEVKSYGEDRGQLMDSAVKDLSRSALGAALTKTYGDENADTISVTVALNPIDAGKLQVYAQEYVDLSSQTLWVRLVTGRAEAEGAAPAAGADLAARLPDATLWRGGRIRLSSEDVRVGRRDEFTLWAEDDDAGLAWVERWPGGGGDLLRGGAVAQQYVYDQRLDRWKRAP